MPNPSAHVPLPQIDFREGMPVSAEFDDVYFSRAGGVAETQHVFLQGNGLPARFRDKPNFTIAELGFGTGLNFLVTWRAFLQEAPVENRLHYLAIEKFPLTPAMLRQVLELQPELAAEAAQLMAAYPLRLPGWHRLHFGRVTLTLGFGDVEPMLAEMETGVDAWFLDGFSPAKNPAMWSAQVLHHLPRLSNVDATVATFTAAGIVKRELEAQGFHVQKVPGYGHKREMLVGRYKKESMSPQAIVAKPLVNAKPVLILGGGIAGCSLAYSLAARGREVVVLERESCASGASGNAAAVLFPQLSKRWTASAAWYFACYSYLQQQIPHWQEAGLVFDQAQPGMLRLPRHTAEEEQLRALNTQLGLDPAMVHWIDKEEASMKAGLPLATGGAWFAQGRWVSPATLCQALLQHPNITYRSQAAVISCTREDDAWRIETMAGEIYRAAQCCIATAEEAARLIPQAGMKLNAVAGQVSVLHAEAVISPLQIILCHKGYVIPAGSHYLIGATYRHNFTACEVTAEDHQTNLAEVARFLPDWIRGNPVAGRVSRRATAPDRLPYIGEVAPGLFVSTGHGSRGMLSAPMAAELIASAICAEPFPVSMALRQAINPLRFRQA